MNNSYKNEAKKIVEDIKAIIKKGNVTRIKIQRKENVILNLPVTGGVILGAASMLISPFLLILTTLIGVKCKAVIIIEKEDGEKIILRGPFNKDNENKNE